MGIPKLHRERHARAWLLTLVAIAAVAVSSQAVACGPEALGTFRTLSVGTAGGGAVGLKSYPATLPLGPKEVVLTFDDGPLPGRTNLVLDALKAECVSATFFVIGRNAAASPGLVRRMVAEGHTVAHHSMTHPMTLRDMSFAKGKANIEEGFAAVDKAAYGISANAPRVPFFRYPGFADTPELNAWLAGRGIVVFGADLWASDWNKTTPEAELKLVMSRLKRTGGGILLLHDIQPHTARMVPALLKALKVADYKIVHIQPGLGGLATRKAPAGWISQTSSGLRGMQ